MIREDYLLRLIKQLGDFLARIAGRRTAGDYAGAVAECARGWEELLGHPRELLEVTDTPTLAGLLREAPKLRVAAGLLVEEARARAASGDPVHAAVCYRRAFELTLEARAIEPHADDDTLLLELARHVPAAQLGPRYRT